MLRFFTQWTMKKVVIMAVSLVVLTTAAVEIGNLFSSGGTTEVELPTGEKYGGCEKPEDGTVADYVDDPKKNLYIATGVLIDAGSFRSETTGTTVSTKIGFSVTQEIRARRVVKGDAVFKESISFGLVKIGDQRFALGDSYLYRNADKVNAIDKILWNDDTPFALSESSYLQRYGCRGNDLSSYLLTDDTIRESSYDGFSDGLYRFSFVLDETKAVPQILYEMKTNSGSKNFAIFTKATISVTMDENWLIRTFETDCAYNVPIAGNTPCQENMVETFSDIGKINNVEDLPEYAYFAKHLNVKPLPPQVDPSDDTSDALSILADMFAPYLQGSPLNGALTVSVDQTEFLADVSVLLDLENLKNTSVRLRTQNGLLLTYAKDNLLCALQNIKLRLSVDDAKDILTGLLASSDKTSKIDPDSFRLDDIDFSTLSESIQVTQTEDGVTASLSIPLGNKDLEAKLCGISQKDGYRFVKAEIAYDGLCAVLKTSDDTVSELIKDDSFLDVGAVYQDYSATLKNLVSLKAEDGTAVDAKEWTLHLKPLTLSFNGTEYTTGQAIIRLLYSPGRAVLSTDRLVLRVNDGKKTTVTELSFKAAYVQTTPAQTNDANGKLNLTSGRTLFLAVNDLKNAQSDLKFSISGEALKECLQHRLPEITEAIPQLKQLLQTKPDNGTLLRLASCLSDLRYDRANDRTLSFTVATGRSKQGNGNLSIALSQPNNSELKLAIQQGTSTTNNAELRITSAPVTVHEVTEAYDIAQSHISLDSIDSLLQSFILTAQNTSFSLAGTIPVDLNALGIKANVNIGVEVKVDIDRKDGEDDIVYVAAKLSRGQLSGITKSAFQDDGGDAYLFYDGASKTITVARNSLHIKKWCKKCNMFQCSKWTTHRLCYSEDRYVFDLEDTGSYSWIQTKTEETFAANIVNNLLEMVNFIDLINNAINDAVNSEEKSLYGIDDVLKDYCYERPTYSVSLDLKPIDNVLGKANLSLTHDEQFRLVTLSGNVHLLDMTGISCTGSVNIHLLTPVEGEAKEAVLTKTPF